MPLVPGLLAATLPPDAVEVGRIQDAWGIKGWVRIHSHSADPAALLSTGQWFLLTPEGRYARGFDAFTGVVSVAVAEVKSHSDGLVAQLADVTDRNAAESLKSARIFVPRSAFPESADPDEYYWVDLLGMAVRNREGVRLGVVSDLLPTGPHTVLVLTDDVDGKPVERMIPFVSAYVDDVNKADRRITVDWQPDY